MREGESGMGDGAIVTIDDTPRSTDVFASVPRCTASIMSDRGVTCAWHRVAYNRAHATLADKDTNVLISDIKCSQVLTSLESNGTIRYGERWDE